MKKIIIFIVLLITLSGCDFINESFANNVSMESINEISQNIIKANLEITVKPYTIDSEDKKVYADHYVSGSGIVFKVTPTEIHILTNRHVVLPADSSTNDYTVQTVNGTEVSATYVFSSDLYDLAVISIERTEEILNQTVVIAMATENAAMSEIVYAVGSPLGMNNILTVGKIYKYSTIDEVDFEVILHSAPINTGNSGGMLINREYKLIGVNTWSVKINGQTYSGATPISEVLAFLRLIT